MSRVLKEIKLQTFGAFSKIPPSKNFKTGIVCLVTEHTNARQNAFLFSVSRSRRETPDKNSQRKKVDESAEKASLRKFRIKEQQDG